MKKLIITLFLTIFLGNIMTACSSKVEKIEPPQTTASQTEPIPSPETVETMPISLPPETTPETLSPESPSPFNETVNRLTGLPNSSPNSLSTRPVAVMVNNHIQSLPQYGISSADIIYEIPVEGGITRLMGIYSDLNNVPDICSIRSCRYYFPLIANGMDAIYIHWGSDESIAAETLKRIGISRLDGNIPGSVAFGRDEKRKKTFKLEHTAYLKGKELANGLKSQNIRLTIDQSKNKPAFNFANANNPKKPLGTSASHITVNFSKTYFSDFTYNSTSKTYKKLHSGKAHMDSSTNSQLEFTNVIVLKTDIKTINPNSSLLDINLKSGNGFYFSNGLSEEILWSKIDDDSPIALSNTNGEPLIVNAGKSYVGIMSNKNVISFS